MSIIYATLERLETDNPPLEDNKGNASSPRLTVESRGFPMKTLVTALMAVLAAANLTLWYWSSGVGGPQNLAPATAADRSVATGRADHRLSPVSMGELSAATLESTEPDSETPTEQNAVSALPTPADMVAVKGKQHIAVKEEAPELDSIIEPPIVAEVRANTVSSQVEKPRTAAAEPDQRKQIPWSDAAQAGGVEQVIERARFSLSRGRYQQALSALESLEPVPENRADFWLIKGSAHLGMGQLGLAEMAFASAQAMAPDNAQIAVQLAILKQEKGDHASALQILKGEAIRHPNVPEIFLNQGYSQQALGAVRDAKRSFRAFLRMTESRSLYLQQRKVVKEWLAQVSSIQE